MTPAEIRELDILRYVIDWEESSDSPEMPADITYPEAINLLSSFEDTRGDKTHEQQWALYWGSTIELIDSGNLRKVYKALKGNQIGVNVTTQGRARYKALVELRGEEAPKWGVSRAIVFIGRHRKAAWVSFATLIGFIWLLMSQVLAPQTYCPLLSQIASEWLAPCVSIATGGNP